MLTPFVTALVVGNCVAGLCLVGSVAFVCGMDRLKKFSDADLDDEGAATNSLIRSGRGADRPFEIDELSKERTHELPSAA